MYMSEYIINNDLIYFASKVTLKKKSDDFTEIVQLIWVPYNFLLFYGKTTVN